MKPPIDYELIFKTIIQLDNEKRVHQIHCKDIPVPSHSLYNYLSEKLNNLGVRSYTPKAIYNLIKLNRNDSHKILKINSLDDAFCDSSANSEDQLSDGKLNLMGADHPGSIHIISNLPLAVVYCSPNQISVFKRSHKEIYADITGGFVKRVKLSTRNTGPIWLFQITVSSTTNECLPIFQMLTERQNSSTLRLGFETWMGLVQETPKIINLDGQKALFEAASLAINGISFEYYLLFSNNIAIWEKGPKPKCMIALDEAHIINNVLKWKSTMKLHNIAKQFYTSSIGMASKLKYALLVYKIFQFLITLCESKTIGRKTDGTLNNASLAYNALKIYVSGESLELLNNDKERESFLNSYIKAKTSYFYEFNEFVSFTETFYETCKDDAQDEGEDINSLYNPSFKKNFLYLIRHMPLWTGVLRSQYNTIKETGVSAPVESMFNILKHDAFPDLKLPVNIDTFVANHLTFIEEYIKLNGCDSTKTNKDNYDKRKENESADDDFASEDLACKSNCSSTSSEYFSSHLLEHMTVESKKSFLHESNNESDENDSTLNSQNNKNLKSPSQESTVTASSNEVYEQVEVCGNADNDCMTAEDVRINPSPVKLNDEIPCIQNGNISKFQLIYDNITLVFRNTCSFDSIISALAVIMTDSSSFREKAIEEYENVDMIQFTQLLLKGIKKNLYWERGNILLKLFRSESLKCSRIKEIDCVSNASNILYFYIGNIINFSRIIKCTRDGCTYSEISCITLDININTLIECQDKALNFDLKHKMSNDFKCNKCRHLAECSVNGALAPLMVLDIFDISTPTHSISLYEIPSELIVLNEVFTLRAVINSIRSCDPNLLNHYVAFCKRNDNTWIRFNDLSGEKHGVALSDSEIMEMRLIPELIMYSK